MRERPKGTIEDLKMFDRSIRLHFAFYPTKDMLWQKARILGISRKEFEKWAEYKRWIIEEGKR